MNCNSAFLLSVVSASTIWTGCLWGISRWLTRGIYSTAHTLIAGVLSLFSVTIFSYAIITDLPFLPAYLFFFSALVVTIFTDVTTLLISQMVTLYTMPIGWILSNIGLLPISPLSSIGGSVCGLLILLAVRSASRKWLDKDGLGQGDIDLLCFIGAFTGPVGCWITLMIGSILGSVIGLIYFIAARGKRDILLPFGLFLGMGAILFVLFTKEFTSLFLPA